MAVLRFIVDNMLLFALLFAGVWAVKKLLHKRLSPAMHYLLWAAVVLKLLLPAALPSQISPWNALALPRADASAQAESAPLSSSAIPGISAPDNDAASAGSGGKLYLPGKGNALVDSGNPGTAAQDSAFPYLPAALAAIWLAGASCAAARLIAGARRLKKAMRRSAAAAVPPAVEAALRDAKSMLGIRAEFRAVVQGLLPVPAIMGLLRPVIVLPAGRLDCETHIRNALLHELAHWKRGDLFALRLLNILSVVYWFNPLVWVCFRLVRRDMETACDATALRVLGENKRLGYVRTVLHFSGPATSTAYAAMGVAGGRAAMKKRVEGMYLRPKTEPRARTAALLLAALLLFAGFTTACQPNPTTPPVVNKGDGKLMDKINETASPAPTAPANATAAPQQTLKAKLSAPDNWKAEFVSENAAVNFKIDADVAVPGLPAAPVVNVEPAPFSQEQVNGMVEALFGGAQLYAPAGMTREQIQEQIVLANADIELAKQKQDTEEDKVWLGKCKASLEYYQKLLSETPENVERTEITAEFQAGREGARQVEAVGEVDGRSFLLTVYNNENSHADFYPSTDGNMNSEQYAISYADHSLTAPQGVKLSREEAEKRARDIAGALDAGMELAATGVASTNGRTHSAWQMIFTRTVDGFPTPYERTEQGESEQSVVQPVYYEKMLVSVDDSGLVGFEWWTPVKVTGTANPDVTLLPFAEIESTAQKMLKTKYSEFFGNLRGDPESMSIDIDRITLGFMRVQVKDQPGKYMLVPVWDFFGDYSIKLSEKDEEEVAKVKGKASWPHREFISMLTINAIDGSVIDRTNGY